MIAAWLAVAMAADGRWLGPGAEAPAATVDLEVEAGATVAVYGVTPAVGARVGWAPVRPVSVGASAGWVGPTATLAAVGARALVLDRAGIRLAAIARGATATRFDGGLALGLAGVGIAAEAQRGRWIAQGALPLVGIERTTGVRWLPGLWDLSLAVAVGRERRIRLRAGAATALALVTVGCSGETRWGRWQVGLVGDGAVNALTVGAGRSWP